MATKKEVETMIYELCAEILLRKAQKDKLKEVTMLAGEHDLLPLLHKEFTSIGKTLGV